MFVKSLLIRRRPASCGNPVSVQGQYTSCQVGALVVFLEQLGLRRNFAGSSFSGRSFVEVVSVEVVSLELVLLEEFLLLMGGFKHNTPGPESGRPAEPGSRHHDEDQRAGIRASCHPGGVSRAIHQRRVLPAMHQEVKDSFPPAFPMPGSSHHTPSSEGQGPAGLPTAWCLPINRPGFPKTALDERACVCAPV